ncbi:hypothetical protein TWF694_004727 [Orbilia ellipsospora]|uniref:DUF7918 domain-containing protein n=1 Tax=Orbilia ellipsospora TaxID=2528407 RepID=A0AAV9WX43_9PEZI
MPSYKGITCDLFVGGEKATEYDQQITGNTCTVWIEAKEDTPYGFGVEIEKAVTGASLHQALFYADGQELRRCLFNKEGIKRSIYTAILNSQESGVITEGDLSFGRVDSESKEGDVVQETEGHIIENVGSLKVKIQRCSKVWDVEPPEKSYSLRQVRGIEEKLVKGKAVSHCTKLGAARIGDKLTWYGSEVIDPETAPYATFIFRYTSKALLGAMGFLGEQDADKDEIDKDVLSMSSEEMQREIMLLRNRANDADIKIKREGDTIDRGEGTSKRAKKKPVVIDLCD